MSAIITYKISICICFFRQIKDGQLSIDGAKAIATKRKGNDEAQVTAAVAVAEDCAHVAGLHRFVK